MSTLEGINAGCHMIFLVFMKSSRDGFITVNRERYQERKVSFIYSVRVHLNHQYLKCRLSKSGMFPSFSVSIITVHAYFSHVYQIAFSEEMTIHMNYI